MHYKLASIISSSKQKSDSICDVFISQPDLNKEELAGKLFIILEIKSNKALALKIINFLIETLNHNYYQNDKIILKERISTIKIEHIFEASLAKTNKDLIDFLKNEKIKISPSALNITVGVIFKNELHFSLAGKNKALLIYKEKIEKISSNKRSRPIENYNTSYKIADVGKNDMEEKRPKEINKIFNDVISGNIPQKGYFIFCNEALPEYLSNKQIIEIVTKLPPLSSAEQIKCTLEKVNAYISFCGLIIKNTQGLPAEKKSDEKNIKLEPQNVEHSVDSLRSTEENTEKLLSSPGIIDLKKMAQKSSSFFSRIKSSSSKANQKLFTLKDRVLVKKKTSRFSVAYIFNLLKNAFAYSANFLAYIYKNITDKNRLSEAGETIKSTPKTAKEKSRESIKWYKSLNKKHKTIFTIAGIFIILFVISVSFTSYSNKRKEEKALFENLINEIEKKQNQVEAYLLYDNEEGAKKAIEENKKLLSQLKDGVDSDNESLNKFLAKHNEQLEKIQHFVIIESPIELANLRDINNQANPTNIIIGNDSLYCADSNQQTVYIHNIENKESTAITSLNIDISELKYPSFNKDNNLYYLDRNSIIELNSGNNEINKISIALPGEPNDISSIAGYNNRLYLLDSKNNQIYRMLKEDDGFTKRDNWLNSEADFSGSTDMAIDGNIYVLNRSGEVKKFFSGKTENLIMDTIEPPLTEADKILVSAEEKGYIYILESNTNRLIIFDKQGDFILQYKSNQLQGIKDFAINEETKKIYILDNNSIFEIEATHFE